LLNAGLDVDPAPIFRQFVTLNYPLAQRGCRSMSAAAF